ncbi:MAG: PEP-CTERM sorting domain-containing protein [Sphaerospermopsis sp. SIO1G2]|nr:PEP-CTERM sorting domain-containing protein [Sphaerospermopsis sp. SIO1G2]
MLKKALVVTSAAIALSAAISLPASASDCDGTLDAFGICQPNPDVETVPEPTTVLGTLFVGAYIGKKAIDARKKASDAN